MWLGTVKRREGVLPKVWQWHRGARAHHSRSGRWLWEWSHWKMREIRLKRIELESVNHGVNHWHLTFRVSMLVSFWWLLEFVSRLHQMKVHFLLAKCRIIIHHLDSSSDANSFWISTSFCVKKTEKTNHHLFRMACPRWWTLEGSWGKGFFYEATGDRWGWVAWERYLPTNQWSETPGSRKIGGMWYHIITHFARTISGI